MKDRGGDEDEDGYVIIPDGGIKLGSVEVEGEYVLPIYENNFVGRVCGTPKPFREISPVPSGAYSKLLSKHNSLEKIPEMKYASDDKSLNLLFEAERELQKISKKNNDVQLNKQDKDLHISRFNKAREEKDEVLPGASIINIL